VKFISLKEVPIEIIVLSCSFFYDCWLTLPQQIHSLLVYLMILSITHTSKYQMIWWLLNIKPEGSNLDTITSTIPTFTQKDSGNHENADQYSWDLNQSCTKYKLEALPLQPTCLILRLPDKWWDPTALNGTCADHQRILALDGHVQDSAPWRFLPPLGVLL
jgi:hypothetical protein